MPMLDNSQLPTGASTSANQTVGNTKLDTLHTDMIAPTPAGTNLIGKVAIDPSAPVTTTMQNAAGATANGTTLDVNGFATTIIEITGTFVATISFEASNDDTNWFAISGTQTGSATTAPTATATGLYRLFPGGVKSLRARISAYTSGTVTCKGRSIVHASSPKVVMLGAASNEVGLVSAPGIVTATTSITRPADTVAYAVGDAYSDSTSAPTAGGFTFTNAARASGKSSILTDMIIVNSNAAATPLTAEILVFDTAVTAVNDNAVFGFSDAEALTLVAKIPFTMGPGTNNNHIHLQNIGVSCTTVGSANLRFLIKVTNAYVPSSAEVLTFRAKFMPVD